MSNRSDLWHLANAFSEEWVNCPITEPFRAGLAPRKRDPGDHPLTVHSVSEVLATFGPLKSQPLLLGKRLPGLSIFAQLSSRPEIQTWLDTAQRFAFALVEVIEFLRSRLPGYPNLLVPDLLPGATRVADDGFWDVRFPWEREVRNARLQFANEPQILGRALKMPDGGRAAIAALAELGIALRATQAWHGFVAAHQNMDDPSRAEAKLLRYEYRQAIEELRVRAIAGDTGMRAADFRRGELDRVKRQAGDRLISYYEAFADVDELIDTIAAWISHRVRAPTFDVFHPDTAGWGPPAELRLVQMSGPDTELMRSNRELVYVSVAVEELSGLVLTGNVKSHFDGAGVTFSCDGRLLTGSGDVAEALLRSPSA